MVFLDTEQAQPQIPNTPLKRLNLVASIAAGVQFGWALQLSLLTPYTQLLGLEHKWCSMIWLCGPISGLIVQPIVGTYSDRCASRFGRRRPFMVAGTVLLSIGVLLIGFAADIGRAFGDSLQPGVKHRAITVFVLGFWLLDISSNMIQGPCRALLADISDGSDALVTIGNALFAFYMAVGNIIGYAAGAYEHIHYIFPFSKTEACDLYCANLKSCFILSILFTSLTMALVVIFAKEERFEPYYEGCLDSNEKAPWFFMQIVIALKSSSKPVLILYLVTALNWFGFFPFTLYDTDWMAKEIYGGKAMGNSEEIKLYKKGVQVGSLGLMVYIVTMGFVSLFLEPLSRLLGGFRRLWGIGNFILAISMGFSAGITKMAENARKSALMNKGTSLVPPTTGVKASCYVLFAVLGLPQAVTYAIPFALASIYSKDSGTGQGLALGLLNLSIVIPQMIVSLVSGPLDSLFGSSNLPAFVMGGIAATLGGIFAMTLLRKETQKGNQDSN
ncbi:hypothetical protein BUALT_Bualt08G0131900 [Buddleja alternifolia]|uniref:Sucrose transporter n=1 Tax=Buddleja alternifolia TaxID=168488 RepID=A0AAV6X7M3_9LAMI|nr:hypothetical protein BUALT_Bualt08G0131900 [Buddleja alternifolia]